MSSSKPAPLVIHGWTVFAHPLFLAQIEALAQQVEAFKQRDPVGYVKKNASMRLAALTAEALTLALGLRRPQAGLLHHSDRGVQYCAHAYREALAQHGITVSMSRRGNCYDNAPMESANGTVKVERVHAQHHATRQAAIDDLTEYIGYYNSERRHSALGYLSPVQYERRWAATQSTPPPSAASYPPSRALPAYEAPHAR